MRIKANVEECLFEAGWIRVELYAGSLDDYTEKVFAASHWCRENFGEAVDFWSIKLDSERGRWIMFNLVFWFKHEQDAMLFSLRWL